MIINQYEEGDSNRGPDTDDTRTIKTQVIAQFLPTKIVPM
jgi:hypothetical protein